MLFRAALLRHIVALFFRLYISTAGAEVVKATFKELILSKFAVDRAVIDLYLYARAQTDRIEEFLFSN